MGVLKKLNNFYDSYILNIVKKEFPSKRTRVYSSRHFLQYFKLMLNKTSSWNSLQFIDSYPIDSIYHYKYANQIFNLWASKDIFKRAYIELLKNNYFKLNTILKSSSINLFIDATYIINKYGIDSIALNPEYRKKKVSKLSIICDGNKNVLSVIPIKIKTTSFHHEITYVNKSLDNLLVKMPDNVSINLIGDKGYVDENHKFKNKTTRLIAPKKKNQHVKNTFIEKELLEDRFKIENCNAFIKKYDRVMVRKDKLLINFMGFVFLDLLDFFCKHNHLC